MMAADRVPHVLFIDDSELTSQLELERNLGQHDVNVRLRPPEEAIESDLRWADVVVVDYFLTNWPERDDTASVARAPRDGLAAAASIRSALLPPLTERGPGSPAPRAVAFALWSGNLKEASFDLPEVVLPHVFSRENNIEWAFRREELLADEGARQVALLAYAVQALPERWPREAPLAEEQMFAMLDLGTGEETSGEKFWIADARRQALDCRPPLHELSERSHGLVLLRWLLHRIFPYPCFLFDELQLCARLRVDALEGGHTDVDSLYRTLAPYEYTGMLAGFRGRRWWRAGVEDWLFTATEGQSGSPGEVASIAKCHGALVTKTWVRPVVVIGGDLARSSTFAEVEQTVRVRPDDWPPFADDAFALRDEARVDPGLRDLVDPADRPLLESAPMPDGSE